MIKKFEKFNLNEDVLEYFIDMDIHHGGNWDVEITSESILPGPVERKLKKPEIYKIKISPRSETLLEKEFLDDLKSRVDRLLSIGEFCLNNGGRYKAGDPNRIKANFGFFSLNFKNAPIGNRARSTSGPSTSWRYQLIEIDKGSIDNIDEIKRKFVSEIYRQSNRLLTDEVSRCEIYLESLWMWFMSSNEYHDKLWY